MDLEVTSNGNTGSIIVEEEVEEEVVSSKNNDEVVHNEDEQVLHSKVNSNEDVAEQAEDDPGVVEVPEQESDQQDMVRNKCPRCVKKFKDSKALATHIRCVHVPKKKCPHCPKLISAVNFNTHVNETHKGGRSKCPECKKMVGA